MIGPENIYLINVGDSRAIIISKEGRVLEFTRGTMLVSMYPITICCLDHKPNVRKEKERIYRAGGRVTEHPDDVPRVQDMLAVSRAFGDYSIDKHIIPPSPDIIEHGKGDKSPAAYVILACDGLWDVMSNEDVAQFVAKRVEHSSLETIAGQLLDHALQLNTMDNVSVYLIKLWKRNIFVVFSSQLNSFLCHSNRKSRLVSNNFIGLRSEADVNEPVDEADYECVYSNEELVESEKRNEGMRSLLINKRNCCRCLVRIFERNVGMFIRWWRGVLIAVNPLKDPSEEEEQCTKNH